MVVMLSYVSLLTSRPSSVSDLLLSCHTPESFSSSNSRSLHAYTSQQLSFTPEKKKKINSPKRSQTTLEEDKGAEMSQAGGAGWAVTWASGEMTHESVAAAPPLLLHTL